MNMAVTEYVAHVHCSARSDTTCGGPAVTWSGLTSNANTHTDRNELRDVEPLDMRRDRCH